MGNFSGLSACACLSAVGSANFLSRAAAFVAAFFKSSCFFCASSIFYLAEVASAAADEAAVFLASSTFFSVAAVVVAGAASILALGVSVAETSFFSSTARSSLNSHVACCKGLLKGFFRCRGTAITSEAKSAAYTAAI